MNNLSTYIVEKLHLNKDIKMTSDNFKKDEEFLCIGLYINSDKEINIKLYNFIFESFKELSSNNEFSYIVSDGRIITKKVFKNNNGYYEYSSKNYRKHGDYISAIFLDKKDSIIFLNSLLNNKFNIHNYFDKRNNDELKQYNIINPSNEEIKEMINQLK